jgi:hypothetical protein
MRTRLPILALALALAACQDLDITNPNLPDRDRATQQPTAVETFVATSFRTWWPVAGHDDYPSWAFATMAREITSGFADFGQLELSAEPRATWNNSPVNARNNVTEVPWAGLYGTISSVNDALIAIDSGLVIVDATRTARTRAVGKFVQGIAHGYLGLYFDQAYIVDETVDVDTVTTPVFHPYPEVIDSAIAQIDAAIAIAQAQDFTLPVNSWLFQAMSRDQFIQLANSFAARLMVYSARTPAERAAVDWNAVMARIDAGITTDFTPTAQLDVLWHDWARLVARVSVGGVPSNFGRPNYWILGPADSTSGFQDWMSTPLNSRVGFRLQTTDRRIQGAAFADTGSYVGFNQSNIFDASRGTYRFSWYFFRRYGTGNTWQAGALPAMLVSEMNLLKAEGLIRTGQAALAVPLINLTRVANGQLPAVDENGPPVEQGCVPRQFADGECGSLWDALRHEKKMEGLGVSGVISFFDARGWQELPENTMLHLPVPGAELAVLQLPLYTFGGGGPGSAPAPAFDACPVGVTLARCP